MIQVSFDDDTRTKKTNILRLRKNMLPMILKFLFIIYFKETITLKD